MLKESTYYGLNFSNCDTFTIKHHKHYFVGKKKTKAKKSQKTLIVIIFAFKKKGKETFSFAFLPSVLTLNGHDFSYSCWQTFMFALSLTILSPWRRKHTQTYTKHTKTQTL